MYTIMALKINQRVQKAVDVQNLLTKYGCIIKVRLGLHESTGDACSNEGLILLQLNEDTDEIRRFQEELSEIKGVTQKTVTI